MSQVRSLSLDLIRTDGDTQGREHLSQEHIDDLAAAYASEEVIVPPISVHFDGEFYWATDGFHRVAGARQAKKASIACDIEKGPHREAWIAALGANKAHGLRRTNEDKRRVTLKALNDQELSGWSAGKIAEHIGVTQAFVSGLKSGQVKSVLTCGMEREPEVVTGRDGKKYRTKSRPTGPRKRKPKPKTDDFSPDKIVADSAKQNGQERKGWDDQLFIEAVGQSGKAIDSIYANLLAKAEECHLEVGGDRQDYAQLIKAIKSNQNQSHNCLDGVTKAFRVMRPAK